MHPGPARGTGPERLAHESRRQDAATARPAKHRRHDGPRAPRSLPRSDVPAWLAGAMQLQLQAAACTRARSDRPMVAKLAWRLPTVASAFDPASASYRPRHRCRPRSTARAAMLARDERQPTGARHCAQGAREVLAPTAAVRRPRNGSGTDRTSNRSEEQTSQHPYIPSGDPPPGLDPPAVPLDTPAHDLRRLARLLRRNVRVHAAKHR